MDFILISFRKSLWPVNIGIPSIPPPPVCNLISSGVTGTTTCFSLQPLSAITEMGKIDNEYQYNLTAKQVFFKIIKLLKNALSGDAIAIEWYIYMDWFYSFINKYFLLRRKLICNSQQYKMDYAKSRFLFLTWSP